MKFIFWSLILASGLYAAEPGDVTSTQFAAKAYPALPIEPPYTFHKQLAEWVEPLRRNASVKLAPGEFEVPRQGWSIVIPSQAGIVLRTAATEFRDYLKRAMQVDVALRENPSLSGWRSMEKAIVAGTRDQLTGCGDGLTGRKDYQIITSPERVVVCGFDDRGAMYGLYNLEARMNFREGYYLPAKLDSTAPQSVQGANDSLGTWLGRMARPISSYVVALRIRFHLRFRLCESKRREWTSSVLGQDEEAGSGASA